MDHEYTFGGKSRDIRRESLDVPTAENRREHRSFAMLLRALESMSEV